MRKTVAIVLFVLVVLSVWVLGNVHLARRLVVHPDLAQPLRGLLLAGIAILAALPLVEPVAQRVLGPRRARVLAWPANVWIGVAFLLMVFFAISDVLIQLSAATWSTATVGGGADRAVARGQAIAVVAVSLLVTGIAVASALRPPGLRRTEVALERWPVALDGFRIVQISDLHIGSLLDERFCRAIVERVNALYPDLIAVTGDLVDGAVEHLAEQVAPLEDLRSRHGAFFVTGNHDYYSGADAWLERVRDLGMRALRNERVEIRDNGAAFDLAGVDDHRAYLFGPGHGEDVPRALAGRDPERAVILLAHDPATFKRASELGIDLQLSGHTHGGQIWPFGYLVRLVVRFVAGHYRKGAAQLLVSRGTGFWGPPMRLAAPAEISEIILRSVRSAPDATPPASAH